MNIHEKAIPQKTQDTTSQRGVRIHQNQKPFVQALVRDDHNISIRETPFHPQIERHVDIISRIRGSAQKNSFILQLQQTYGNRYAERVISHQILRGMPSIEKQFSPDANSQKLQRKDEQENKARKLPPAILAEINKEITALGDPRPIPDEDTIKKARTQGEKQGKQLEKLANMNKPLTDLLLLDMMEKSLKESISNQGDQSKDSEEGKKARERLQIAEVEDKNQRRDSRLATATEWAVKIAAFIKMVPGVMNYFFSFLNMITDWKAGRSAGKEYADLDAALTAAEKDVAKEHGNADPQMGEVIKAIRFAVGQKNRKWWKRWISFSTTLAATGVSISTLIAGQGLTIAGIGALLASNPIGWGIALTIGAIGFIGSLALGLYKLYRWWNKRDQGILGKDRKEVAMTLFSALVLGKDKPASLAKEAVTRLGLSPDRIIKGYNQTIDTKARQKVFDTGVSLIMQRLKSV